MVASENGETREKYGEGSSMTIQTNIPMADYLALDALSSGVANRIITQSPRHALYSQIADRTPSKVSDTGEIIHRLLLEGHMDGLVIGEFDDWRTNAAKDLKKAAYAENKIPILARDIAPIKAAVKSAEMFVEQSEIAGIFDHENGHPEVTVTWDWNGVACKARPDYLTDGIHLSIKTTAIIAGAAPADWSRKTMTNMGYDFAMTFYRKGLTANDVDARHLFLVVEQNAPFGCSLVEMAPNRWAISDADSERSVKIWAECQKTKTYPGYPTNVFYAEASPWQLAAAEERELEILVGA